MKVERDIMRDQFNVQSIEHHLPEDLQYLWEVQVMELSAQLAT